MSEMVLLLLLAVVVFALLVVTPIALLIGLRRMKKRVAAMEVQLRELQRDASRPGPLPESTAAAGATVTAPPTGEPEPVAAEEEEFFDQAAWRELEAESADKPSLIKQLAGRAGQWLLGGNTVARVGAVLIFFGVAFLLKYVAESGLLPIELRLAGVALGGMALTAVGWRLRGSRRSYALILQGGGIGVIYLTLYAAFSLYQLIPALPGLALMVVLVALSSALAVLQDARGLAVLAVAGGFLAPLLMSSGVGDHILLFSYYALLNAGIVAIAWHKAWRELNLLGFAFTFGIGAFWGLYAYRPEQLLSTELFLILFFLIYVAVPILFARSQPTRLQGYVDGTLVFGVPLVASVLQSGLMHRYEYGLALSALVVGLFYTLLASTLWRRRLERLRLLTESFLALAVVFGTLAIPLALDGRITGAAWALEGAALVWVGVRQGRLSARLFGLLVQLSAALALATASPVAVAEIPVLNSRYLGVVMIALAGLFSAWQLYRHREALHPSEADATTVLLVWGLGWWLFGGGGEISRYLEGPDRLHALLCFFALSAAALAWLRRRLDWEQLIYPPLLLLPALAVIALTLFFDLRLSHPFATWGLPAWALALGMQYGMLRLFEEEWSRRELLRYGHLGALWLLLFLLAWEAAWALAWWIEGASAWQRSVWGLVAWGLVPAAAMAGLPMLAGRLEWPVGRFAHLYLDPGQLPVAGFLALWVLYAATRMGDPQPLSYLPLLNPLELTQLLALFVLLWRARQLWAQRRPELVWYGWAAVAFVALNGIIARASHFLGGVPFTLDGLWDAPQFQTALSVTWTAAALAVTVMATRLRQRPAWIAGAALLGAVVVKLFLVDLAEVGTVARIVSFLVVGGLALLIGYLSPLPPNPEESVKESAES